VNDDTTKDKDGDNCSGWYDTHPLGCGKYDDEDFVANDQCCACGGGSCVNDDSTSDRYRDTCSDYYDKRPDKCGDYDDADFVAADQCCICKPGAPAVDGNWGSWTEWLRCSKNCGGGTQYRSRSCDNPMPSNGGSGCSGDSKQQQDCNTHDCPPGECVNDDSTKDKWDHDCTWWYDRFQSGCYGTNDDDDFTAMEQCCACKKLPKRDCNPGCKNGGYCIGKNKCECPPNYYGYICQSRSG